MKTLIALLSLLVVNSVLAQTLVYKDSNVLFGVLDQKTDGKVLYKLLDVKPIEEYGQSIKLFSTRDSVFTLSCTKYKNAPRGVRVCAFALTLNAVLNQNTHIEVDGKKTQIYFNNNDSEKFDAVFTAREMETDLGTVKKFVTSDRRVTLECTRMRGFVEPYCVVMVEAL